MAGIYEEPELYAAASAYRNVPGDVDALLRWWRRHSCRGYEGRARLPQSVLELAAGPADHAREMAMRGIEATALDLSPAMCAWARARAAEQGCRLTVIEADMRSFAVPDTRQFDMAMTLVNSLCHLLTLDDLIAHLASTADHVVQGGLYIVELAHPADLLIKERRKSNVLISDIDGGSVAVRWGSSRDRIDPITQVTREHVTVTYRKKDGSVRTLRDVLPNRFWTATELDAAVRLSGGFTIASRYGDFIADIPLEDPNANRMILVLCRSDCG